LQTLQITSTEQYLLNIRIFYLFLSKLGIQRFIST